MTQHIKALRNQMHLILLLGPNGAGKDLKGKILLNLAGNLGLERIVMSDVIDAHRRNKTNLGSAFDTEQDKQNNGKLLSDAPVINALEPEIVAAHGRGARFIVLDGFPRNMAQFKHLISYRIPFTAFFLEVDEATCLRRIAERSLKEKARMDDAKAQERFHELSYNIGEMWRMLKRMNPHACIPIKTNRPVREQTMIMLKALFSKRDVLRMAACLNKPDHPARKLIDAAEKPIVRGGASAHMIDPRDSAHAEPLMPQVFVSHVAEAAT